MELALFCYCSREAIGFANSADALTHFRFHVCIYFYLRVWKSP